MRIPLVQTQHYTAINVEIDPPKIHIGILYVEPNAPEKVPMENFEFWLKDDLIGKPKFVVAREYEFEIDRD